MTFSPAGKVVARLPIAVSATPTPTKPGGGVLINALARPLSTIIFASPSICGLPPEESTPVTVYVGLAAAPTS